MANNAAHHIGHPILLLTRPRASAEAFASTLDPRLIAGVEIVFSPLVKIAKTGVVVDLRRYSGVVFTSGNAPDLVQPGEGRPAYCVGARTAQAAMKKGWSVQIVAQTAADLLDQIHGIQGPLIHLAGAHRRGDIVNHLRAQGTAADVEVVYTQPAQDLSEVARAVLVGKGNVIAPVFSPRTAQILARQVSDPKNLHVIAMSDPIAEALGTIVPKSLTIAAKPTGAEMRIGVEMLLARHTLP